MSDSTPFLCFLSSHGLTTANRQKFEDFQKISLLILHGQKKIFATVNSSLLRLHIKVYLAFLIKAGYEFGMRNDRWPIYVALRQENDSLTTKIVWHGDVLAEEFTVCEDASIFR